MLGLLALINNRAVIDYNKMMVYFLGPGEYDLEKGMPAGTEKFQAERSPSGHMVLPCCEYNHSSKEEEESLTLLTKDEDKPAAEIAGPPGLPSPFQ